MKPTQRHQTESEVPRHRSKKDTKRWCKGIEGRLHTPVWKENVKFPKRAGEKHSPFLTFECQGCGKAIDSYSPWRKGKAPQLGSTEPRDGH